MSAMISDYITNLWYKVRFYFLPSTSAPKRVVPYGMEVSYEYTPGDDIWSRFNKWYSDTNEPGSHFIPKLDCITMTDEGLVLSTGVNYDVATHDRYKFKSGLLSTKGRFSQLYGRFDLTCKLPEYEGLYWPAFWLFGAVWPPEIDIFEAMAGEYKSNKQTRHFSTTYHWSDSDGIHKQLGRRLKSRQDLSKEFHTYGVEWTKDKMVWYFDGYPIYQQTGNSPNIPMHVVINTAIAHDATIQQVYQSPAKFVIKNLTVYKTVDK